MALVFRWYLGQSSHWANAGEASRAVDYQVWCGPSMAAFNEWVRGSFLEKPEARTVELVARNILYHASVLARSPVAGLARDRPAAGNPPAFPTLAGGNRRAVCPMRADARRKPTSTHRT